MFLIRPTVGLLLLFGVVALSSLFSGTAPVRAGLCAQNLEHHGCQRLRLIGSSPSSPSPQTLSPIRVASLTRLVGFEPVTQQAGYHQLPNKGRFNSPTLLLKQPEKTINPRWDGSKIREQIRGYDWSHNGGNNQTNNGRMIRDISGLVATPFKIRDLKAAHRRAKAARIRVMIAREIAPIIFHEKTAKAATKRAHIAALRKHAMVLRRFRAVACCHRRQIQAGKFSALKSYRAARSRLSYTHGRLPLPLSVPTNHISKTAGIAQSNFAGSRSARTVLRLASLGDSQFPVDFDSNFQTKHSQGGNNHYLLPFKGADEQDLSAWIALQEKAYAPLVATPVVIRGLKARFARAGHELTKAPGIFETEVDPDLLAPPVKFHSKKNHSKKINLTPPIRRLPAITTKRRSLKRRLLKRWMLVRSAYTKCFPKRLTRLLKQVSRHYGKPVIVISGYRSPAHNRRVGGARRSQHMRCTAADFRVPGVSKMALARYVKTLRGRGGVGTYCRSSYIHLDVGPRRTWHWGCGRGKRRIVKRRRYYRKKAMVRRKAIARKRVVRRAQKRGRNPRLSKRRTNRKTS